MVYSIAYCIEICHNGRVSEIAGGGVLRMDIIHQHLAVVVVDQGV